MEGIQEKIDLVKSDLFNRHPGCPHTIRILLWDDDTDMVECRYGDDEKLYISSFYAGQLNYTELDVRGRGNGMLVDEKGTEYLPIQKINN